MKIFNYITLLIAFFMMNIMYAELKTFGMPTDSETDQLPTEEVPSEEAPSEEAPKEEVPTEEAPVEEVPSEEDVMPSASDDSEANVDQPIKFKEEIRVAIRLGSTIPFGTNLKNNFSSGMNLQADVTTPFAFSGITILGHLSMFNLSPSGEYSSNYTEYNVKNIGLKLNKKVSFLDISLGSGLSFASGKTMYIPYDDYSMTTLFISGSLSYTLPLSNMLNNINMMNGMLENIEVELSAGGMEIFGAPSDSGTSDLIDFGISVSYPFLF